MSTRTGALVLAGGLLLALLLQQLLLRRPPRLESLAVAPASSGPAALDLRFSRPMQNASVARDSRLYPPLPHQWLGDGNPLRLLLGSGQTVAEPLRLEVAGQDRRGLALAPQRWRWDPRPRLLAVVALAGGEQVQLLGHDGRWRPLSPIWPAIPTLTPLGNGSALAFAASDSAGRQSLWLLPLRQHNLNGGRRDGASAPLREPEIGRLERLSEQPLVFAHLSSNRRGDLLVQAGSQVLAGTSTTLLRRDGGRVAMPQTSSGPMQLLPEGSGVVVPQLEGLSLQALPGQPPRRQLLPGSRDLLGFCPVGGRALLRRHWPDFRRSLELVEPGQAPRQLWLGDEALLAAACDRGGERVWVLVSAGLERPRLELLALERSGRVAGRRSLTGWELEPGTGLQFDPTSRQLLLALRRQGANSPRVADAARPALIDGRSLDLKLLGRPVRQVQWLTAG